MTIATTPADVKAINGSTLDDVVIQPFIDAADCILQTVSGCTSDKGITSACLDIARAWLAAHLMGMSSIGNDTLAKKKESFENYTVERVVGGFSGKGILSTPYGQTANSLTGGCLQEADKGQAKVCFFG